jgi:hypothetical protein
MAVISGTRAEQWRRPTRASMALFEAKATAFRLRRGLLELGRAPQRLRRAAETRDFVHVASESVSELWPDLSLVERGMQIGKVQNLRRAAAALDGLELPAGQVFSFWRQVGRATRAGGYVEGRMLREGCMVASVGGGLCQLSNALYDAALAAGCEIVERHAHSHVVPGSAAVAGRDATVAWNYVDLRFVSQEPRLLRVILGARTLTVRLLARAPAPAPGSVVDRAGEGDGSAAGAGLAERCSDCDQTDCFLHEHGARAALAAGGAAFLVDEAWPELMDYVHGAAADGDLLAAPDFWRWPRAGFAAARDARLASAMRSLGWRLTPPQGAARRLADARATAAIASALARWLRPETLDLTVAQSLLPYLWRLGALGGRRLTVLMTRLPMAALQARLDAAFAAHPDRATLADYRAEPWLATAESEALAAAERIVTPHTEIAGLFGERAVVLPWRTPSASAPRRGEVFAFPGPTVARKGAYELRAAAKLIGAPVRPLGAELEGPDFWAGALTDRAPDGASWLEGVRAVVHPALVEAAPRRLLEALAAGVPVIATAACGIEPRPGLTIVMPGDAHALAEAMRAVT